MSVRPEGSERAHSLIPEAPEGRRTYVLDTSVLLSDPRALLNFAEHEVVVPIVVITELEGKRHHPELGHFARAALRILDRLRLENGGLVGPVPVNNEGGVLLVELNHSDPLCLPDGFRLGDNDTRILAVAQSYRLAGHSVVLVTKDLPLRVKASAIGLEAEEYRHELVPSSGWTGMVNSSSGRDDLDPLRGGERRRFDFRRDSGARRTGVGGAERNSFGSADVGRLCPSCPE